MNGHEENFCKCSQSFKKIALKGVVKQKISPFYSTGDDTSISSIDHYCPGVSGCESELQPGAYVLIKGCESDLQPGAYVLIKFFGDHPNKEQYRYVGVCQEYDTVDGDLKVKTGENGQLFRLIEEGISYVQFDQIRCILPNSELEMKDNRVYCAFPFQIDIFEKA